MLHAVEDMHVIVGERFNGILVLSSIAHRAIRFITARCLVNGLVVKLVRDEASTTLLMRTDVSALPESAID